jgi:hypothetical protein
MSVRLDLLQAAIGVLENSKLANTNSLGQIDSFLHGT